MRSRSRSVVFLPRDAAVCQNLHLHSRHSQTKVLSSVVRSSVLALACSMVGCPNFNCTAAPWNLQANPDISGVGVDTLPSASRY